MRRKQRHIVRFEDVGMKDVARVGGKNASLGEMIRELAQKGVRVPSGFIVTADAYQYFLRETGMQEFIRRELAGLRRNDLRDLARRGKRIRHAFVSRKLPDTLFTEITFAYRRMETRYGKNVDVAVRSSATAEDLPNASFAGEHETYLGIRGAENVAKAVRAAMASLFTDRAIAYREDKGFDHFSIALSVGVQKMVRSDKGASGVMFTLDTETGFKDAVIINATWGLGEMIVQGEVTPDEFIVFKRTLKPRFCPIIDKRLGVKEQKMVYTKKGRGIQATKIVAASIRERTSFVLQDHEILKLARWGVLIERHYSKTRGAWTPMDIEWAKDGLTGELSVVQARPETVHAGKNFATYREYRRSAPGKVLVKGASVGSQIAYGKARVILHPQDIGRFKGGEILVTTMTDPDWEPVMKIASAIVTDKGGRTSHAAIVSRELGIPAVVGTESATKTIQTGDSITVDTTGNEGFVLKGKIAFRIIEHDIRKLPKVRTKLMVNIAMPDSAFGYSFLPHAGVGLAREEFIIASKIGVHPLALLRYGSLPRKIRQTIDRKVLGWSSPARFYADNLAFGIAKIGAAFFPHPVIVRFSDFKTNEYRSLLGGETFEPHEENPMLGWRGASRYYDPRFREAFALECAALRKVRRGMGLKNVLPMVPFCRTIQEGKRVLAEMARHGLDRRNDRGLKIYVMCEVPSNVLMAEAFLRIFDGMSIGSNDLTQLTLGLDRDSGIVNRVGNENDPAVKKQIAEVIRLCRAKRKYVGICGQAPSDYPQFAAFLVREGIESISLNPDTFIPTLLQLARL